MNTVASPVSQAHFYIVRNGQDLGPHALAELQSMAARRQLRAPDLVRTAIDQRAFPARQIPWVFSTRSWPAAVILSLVLGTFGADRFYLGHVWLGLAKLLSFGGLGIWWLVDLVLIAFRQVNDSEGRPLC